MTTLRNALDTRQAPETGAENPQVFSAGETNPSHEDAPAVKGGAAIMIFALTLSAFWIGAACAYLWGYFGVEGLVRLGPHLLAFSGVVTFIPPVLFVLCAFAFTRASAMNQTARRLAAVSDRLTHVDESAAIGAQRLGRAVRRELDALSAGLDGAFGRLRALETALEDRVAQLEDAGARAGVKADAIASRLRVEREGIESLAVTLDTVAARAAETLAGKSAQLKAMVEAAGGELKSAASVLDVQTAQFREAAEKAANAPREAALELDRQAQTIETASNNAVARAEFVLARQERQRVAMTDLMARLKDEAATFEAVLEAQAAAIEKAANQMATEATRLDTIADHGLRRIDAAMGNAAARTTQLASGFGREADRVKDAADAASGAMSRLVDSLRDATASAQALLTESTSEAKRRSNDFVGEAMGQADQLLRAASSVAEQAEKARAMLAKAAEEAERHIVALPGIAAQEAERVREALRNETEHMLDMSARTLATLHSRTSQRRLAENAGTAEPSAASGSPEGLRGLARRITAQKRKSEPDARLPYDLSAVLAAAEGKEISPKLKQGVVQALGALQAALSDLASDLEAAAGETADPHLWRRYLDGDRGVFARKLAHSIGPDTVDRIAGLYRDNPAFRDAANAYLDEFEALLARAREGDRDGLLASTMLTADTGKIYLAVAYALGRLE